MHCLCCMLQGMEEEEEDEQVCLFPTLVWGVASLPPSLRYKMGGKEEETKDRREGMHQASSDLVL